jgi:hypothetical protein
MRQKEMITIIINFIKIVKKLFTYTFRIFKLMFFMKLVWDSYLILHVIILHKIKLKDLFCISNIAQAIF